MVDRAVGVNISLYQSQYNKVKKFAKTKNFRSDAAAFQYILDDFFKKSRKKILKDFMVYAGYPVIFAGLMLYISLSTQKINELLVKNAVLSDVIANMLSDTGILYDLMVQNQIFYIIGFAWIGIGIAGFAVFFSKYRSKD